MYLKLGNFAVQQKLTEHCESTITKNFKKKLYKLYKKKLYKYNTNIIIQQLLMCVILNTCWEKLVCKLYKDQITILLRTLGNILRIIAD